jgi:hypothetical protein
MFVMFVVLTLQGQVLPVVPAVSTAKAECVSDADGAVSCGFSCQKTARGRVGCAAEPGGSCIEDVDGSVTCSAPIGVTLHLPLTAATCIDGADGSVGCGYGCVVDGAGRVHCANSPDGACAVSPAGRATCTRFDLTRRVFVLDGVPPPRCLLAGDGGVTCGYGCVKAPRGVVRCARTPDGACRAGGDGVIACTDFDPARRVFLGAPPEATCLRDARGRATCGYGCVTATSGVARCSASPFGICARRSDGHVRCFPDDERG